MTSRAEATVGLIEVAPEVRRMTAPNPSPLTADGTHSFIVGRGEVVVVDPGPANNHGHIERLATALEDERVVGIALTHRHLDHGGAVDELASATGAEMLSAAQLEDLDIEVIAAPGHTSDHVVFRHGRTLLTGDHVFQDSSTLIDWPDGSVSAFLETTRFLQSLSHLEFHPAHGPQLSDPLTRLDWLIAHRESRSADILAVLKHGGAVFDAIFAATYADTPANLREAATRNLSAHLSDLAARGLVVVEEKVERRTYRLSDPN